MTFMIRPKVSRPTGTCKHKCVVLAANQILTGFDTADGSEAYCDWSALTEDCLPSDQTIGGLHGNSSHSVFTHVIRHFQHDTYIVVLDLQCCHDVWQLSLELDIDDSADDLNTENLIADVHKSSPCDGRTCAPVVILAPAILQDALSMQDYLRDVSLNS